MLGERRTAVTPPPPWPGYYYFQSPPLGPSRSPPSNCLVLPLSGIPCHPRPLTSFSILQCLAHRGPCQPYQCIQVRAASACCLFTLSHLRLGLWFLTNPHRVRAMSGRHKDEAPHSLFASRFRPHGEKFNIVLCEVRRLRGRSPKFVSTPLYSSCALTVLTYASASASQVHTTDSMTCARIIQGAKSPARNLSRRNHNALELGPYR